MSRTVELHAYSDEALLAEVARRLALRTPTSGVVNDVPPLVRRVEVPAFQIPENLASVQHDSDAIRQLLHANRDRLGLRRCEIGEAFRLVGRTALNVDQKVQYLIDRNEL